MKLVAVSVYDSRAGVYSHPQYFRSNGEAIRSFVDAAQDERSNIARHVSDFSFWKVGIFDDNDGSFVPDMMKLMEGVEAIPKQ